MSLVVADSSPLNYLVVCQVVDVLPQLYGQVVIPQAVFDELSHPGAPEVVRGWLTPLPSWASVRAAASVDAGLALGKGEAEAISLAQEIQAADVLLDERRARDAALERGLKVTGTLGVLEAAAKEHLLDLPEVLQRLTETNFRIAPALLRQALERDAIRRDLDRAPQPNPEPDIER